LDGISPIIYFFPQKIKLGPTGIRTQVARFKVWSDNHYTMEPFDVCEFLMILFIFFKRLDGSTFEWLISNFLFVSYKKKGQLGFKPRWPGLISGVKATIWNHFMYVYLAQVGAMCTRLPFLCDSLMIFIICITKGWIVLSSDLHITNSLFPPHENTPLRLELRLPSIFFIWIPGCYLSFGIFMVKHHIYFRSLFSTKQV
jgi:hypothetical protein